MKSKVIISIALLLAAGVGRAQENHAAITGIYFTEDDFKNNRLQEATTASDPGRLTVALGRLKAYRNGEVKTFQLRDIYGYYHNGARYRVFRRRMFFDRYASYRVIDDSNLWVYSSRARGHKRGGYTFYYWSQDTGAPVVRITKRNLRSAFRHEPEFVRQTTEDTRVKTLHLRDAAGQTVLNVYYNNLVRQKMKI